MQRGLLCEMGQFIKASQSKDKTLKLELACRGKAYTPSQQCFWITGAGSRGLAPARRVKRRHKMVVRIECYLPTLPWGEKQQNIAGPHTYTSQRCYKLDRWGSSRSDGERGCLIPTILMGEVVWGCELEFGELVWAACIINPHKKIDERLFN